ncbi:putative transposable element [Trichonephila clavipes]|uniref:Putative transposable element n=1 Tax=Trichonephila clavipes TaxID=2585209 RepID=A0A8X6VY06_TRICX|nr:putative transposable element [Trichonephila clavipes]
MAGIDDRLPPNSLEGETSPSSGELWFQQDGATCHTARATIDLLKDTFGDRLISRFGPVNWPPRSCDLTPLDYFLWDYVKSLVYALHNSTVETALSITLIHGIVTRTPPELEPTQQPLVESLRFDIFNVHKPLLHIGSRAAPGLNHKPEMSHLP